MKVPKMYKSSDRYNAGTDVIYNDDSKLQYAPFIYATTQSGDSGEEGDDTMAILSVKMIRLSLLEDATVESFGSIYVDNDNSAFTDGTDTVDISKGIFCPYFVLNDAEEFSVIPSGTGLIYSVDGEYVFNVYNNATESKTLSTGIVIVEGVFYQLME